MIDPSTADALSRVPPASGGSYPIRVGNLVRPLVDAAPAFRSIATAIAAARHSVWLTVAFCRPDFCFPDDGRTLFDLLDSVAARGLDVRALFWCPNPESAGYGDTFAGTEADRDLLRTSGARFSARPRVELSKARRIAPARAPVRIGWRCPPKGAAPLALGADQRLVRRPLQKPRFVRVPRRQCRPPRSSCTAPCCGCGPWP